MKSNPVVCILGCGGFIGSHLLDRILSTGGGEVIGIDKSPAKIKAHLSNPRLSFIEGDIYGPGILEGPVRKSDIVVSLAALCNPSLYNTIPLRVIENNFTQPCAMVKLCADMGKWLIHFSTCEVYGRTLSSFSGGPEAGAEEPFNEDNSPFVLGPLAAQRWTYACAKQLLERLIYACAQEKGLRFTIVRPFNFIGPRMDYIPGIDGEGLPRVVACFMEALLLGKPLQLVDGGRSRRTFTYISDAVDAVMAIMNHPDEARGQLFNIGNPANETTIAGLARKMAGIYAKLRPEASAATIDIIDVPSEEFYGKGYDDSDRRVPDIAKARALLGWEPVVPLDHALYRTVEAFIRDYAEAAGRKGDSPAR